MIYDTKIFGFESWLDILLIAIIVGGLAFLIIIAPVTDVLMQRIIVSLTLIFERVRNQYVVKTSVKMKHFYKSGGM